MVSCCKYIYSQQSIFEAIFYHSSYLQLEDISWVEAGVLGDHYRSRDLHQWHHSSAGICGLILHQHLAILQHPYLIHDAKQAAAHRHRDARLGLQLLFQRQVGQGTELVNLGRRLALTKQWNWGSKEEFVLDFLSGSWFINWTGQCHMYTAKKVYK